MVEMKGTAKSNVAFMFSSITHAYIGLGVGYFILEMCQSHLDISRVL